MSVKYNFVILNYVFIVLTETWLSTDIFYFELGIDNYNVYSYDRNNLMST